MRRKQGEKTTRKRESTVNLEPCSRLPMRRIWNKKPYAIRIKRFNLFWHELRHILE
jgi:hypothetical protein